MSERSVESGSEYYGIIPFNRNSGGNGRFSGGSGLVAVGAESNVSTISEDNGAAAEDAVIKLRRELAEEHEKVMNLTSQLATNAHVVAAFEQSLANMTARLQHLTATSEMKDHELVEMRKKIELFKQSGVDAGLIEGKLSQDLLVSDSGDEGGLSSSSKPKKRSGWLRSSFSKAFKGQNQGQKANKQLPSRIGSAASDVEDTPKHKVKNHVAGAAGGRSASALSGQIHSPLPMSPIKSSKSTDTIEEPPVEIVNDLKRQLVEKENLLTETRLEALSSAHQLESLRDTVTKMRNELMSVKSENEKLQTIVASGGGVDKSLASSQSSLNKDNKDHHHHLQDQFDQLEQQRRHSSTLSESSILSGPSSLDLSATTDPTNREGGKLVPVIVINRDRSFTSRIGTVSVSGRSNWELLDSLVHRLFKEYVMRVDPTSNLGLSADSIAAYQVGSEVTRSSKSSRKPELLPYGYLVGDNTDITIVLRSSLSSDSDSIQIDALAFETLTPKAIVQRYVSLLLEHKRVILSGPSGSGKTFMATKLANFLLSKNSSSAASSIATFGVQRNNVPEMKDFLARNHGDSSVIILDNLQHAGRLDEVLADCSLPKDNFIIGTLNPSGQGAQTPTNLQLQHNFR